MNTSNTAQQAENSLRLVYIIGTYPGLTTTFIDREIKTLRRWGIMLQIVAIRRPPRGTPLSDDQRALQQGISYLLPIVWRALVIGHLFFLLRHPIRFLATLAYLLTRPHPDWRARVKTLLHFGEGVYAAYRLRGEQWNHIHAHFADRAATVALVSGRLLGLPYSLTAHANDIYVRPLLLREKIAGAAFVATCTGYNHKHLLNTIADRDGNKVLRIYHGLDLSRYQPPPGDPDRQPLLLAVGQLKEKKGLRYLVEACNTLRERGYRFECQIVGEGPQRAELEARIAELGLSDVVRLIGALPHPQVIERYHQAAIFVLPCVQGADGDRDGIPNVILEAMAMQLPIVSTRYSGIPEAVEDEVNGLLVPAADSVALADAIARLLDDPALGRLLGRRGRQLVAERFDLTRNARHLLDAFQTSRAAPAARRTESTSL